MPADPLHTFTRPLPIPPVIDNRGLACSLDRLADLALAHGRDRFAENLAHRAQQMREAQP
jgi:hypothetical protein